MDPDLSGAMSVFQGRRRASSIDKYLQWSAVSGDFNRGPRFLYKHISLPVLPINFLQRPPITLDFQVPPPRNATLPYYLYTENSNRALSPLLIRPCFKLHSPTRDGQRNPRTIFKSNARTVGSSIFSQIYRQRCQT